MSFLDYFKVTHDREIQKVLRRSAEELLKRQKKDPRDIMNLGRFDGTMASSGNGWINEVLGELYTYSKSIGRGDSYRCGMPWGEWIYHVIRCITG